MTNPDPATVSNTTDSPDTASRPEPLSAEHREEIRKLAKFMRNKLTMMASEFNKLLEPLSKEETPDDMFRLTETFAHAVDFGLGMAGAVLPGLPPDPELQNEVRNVLNAD